MTGENYLTFVGCAICILIGLCDLRIDATDPSLSMGTCDSEESENGLNFCDSNDEHKYLGNREVSDVESQDSTLEGNEPVTTSSENSTNMETLNNNLNESLSESENNESLSESEDKQIDVTNNSTNEWLGLQIPVVDGVRVSVVFVILF